MATIIKEIEINRSKETVWDAIRDVGSIHERLVVGFVTDCKLEGDWRTLTFANGMTLRELIVNVNTATEAQLRTLPGIDKVIAGRIVAQRPFKRVNDLLRVDGIGPKVLEKIRPYVKVDGETEPS